MSSIICCVETAQCATFNATLKYSVCNITHEVPLNASSSESGNVIVSSLDTIYEDNPDLAVPLPSSCVRMFVAFYCNQYYPVCVPDVELSALGVCASQCQELISACQSYLNLFNDSSVQLKIPSDCSQYSSSDYCTNGTESANIYFWFPDGPSTSSPNSGKHSSSSSGSWSNSDVVYPPGGPVSGGLIGAGMLVALMAMVFGLMIVMKRQDSK